MLDDVISSGKAGTFDAKLKGNDRVCRFRIFGRHFNCQRQEEKRTQDENAAAVLRCHMPDLPAKEFTLKARQFLTPHFFRAFQLPCAMAGIPATVRTGKD